MALKEYGTIPSSAKLDIKPFIIDIAESKLQLMKEILQLSPVGQETWENTSTNQGDTKLSNPSRKHGMRRDWLTDAKEYWLHAYNWRETETRLNSFSNFIADVQDSNGRSLSIHFIALFSKRKDAIPIAFYHGWPGSILEFLGVLDIIRQKYSPENLPYHIIVPSLPGFCFSGGPPVDADYTTQKAAEVLHFLLLGLGFNKYLVQGGDAGSFVSRFQATSYAECAGMLLNRCVLPPTVDRQHGAETMSAFEASCMARGEEFRSSGAAYVLEQGTRPATVGLVLASSPLAVLAWVGEKFLEWTDKDPSVKDILDSASLYWLTDTFPRCLYIYKTLVPGRREPLPYVGKPSGFIFFPKESEPTPEYLVKQAMHLVAYYSHKHGGHFGAFEQPELLFADVEDWVSKVWTSSSKETSDSA